jgi:hypothetical protein
MVKRVYWLLAGILTVAALILFSLGLKIKQKLSGVDFSG